MINIIGDSHVHSFEGMEDVRVYHFEPDGKNCTAFHLWDKWESSSNLLATHSDELWLFHFGEIDARIHIYNQHMKTGQRKLRLCNAVALKYTSLLGWLSLDYNVAILIPPPQGFEGNIYEYPFYADRETREAIFMTLCEMIDYNASMFGIPVYDCYRHYTLPDKDFYYDEVHVKPEIAIPLLRKEIEDKNRKYTYR
jgi:hypothetical protein